MTGPGPRAATAADLATLPPRARDALLAAGATIDVAARVSTGDVAALLAASGFAAHPAALAFDARFAGVEVATAHQYLGFGVRAMLEGRLKDTFERLSPVVDDSDEDTLAWTQALRERSRALTPIGVALANELSLYMDADGAVHWYSAALDELGVWAPDEASFLASLADEIVAP